MNDLKQSLNDKTPIQKYYKGKNVFVTGGTGFTGQILIERLLHNFDDIGTVYLLLRGKKNKTYLERFDRLLNSPIFSRMPKHQMAKLVPIYGQTDAMELDMNERDRDLLINNVNLVFHCAATVKFDESLGQSFATNARGTCYIVRLCKAMKDLQALVHVSTCYVHSQDALTEEKFYDCGISVDDIFTIANKSNSDLVDILSHKLIGSFANSYSLSKCAAENVVLHEGRELPAAIFRPSIIFSASTEYPYPGFVNSMIGPSGHYATMASGLNRIFPSHSHLKANSVPVDYCANAMIIIGWELANTKYSIPPIYTLTTAGEENIEAVHVVELFMQIAKEAPLPDTFWWPNVTIVDNKLYCALLLLGQLFLSLLLDAYLALTLKPTGFSFLKLQVMLARNMEISKRYTVRNNVFVVENMKALRNKLSPEDRTRFYTNLKNFDWQANMTASLFGFRYYLLRIPHTDVIRFLKRNLRLKKLYYCFNALIIAFGIFVLFKLILHMVNEWNL